ncbi:glycosyltransferase family 2 protein [Luteimonas notoginsengisoli]|jgi:teichuronic acid biosynthesis glycosyltransferase TuaG|uniref:Glycosyltransferase family 2 protein n=1 Tax=Luteimonas notoginsengisoli TaxID=1578200 RepID=A0ABV7UW51_9GAMM
MESASSGTGVRVSVVMPVYNAENTMRRSIESVLGQSFADLELVAVDDGSTDASVGILREYAAADSRVRLIRQDRNAGVAAARNAGLAAASGSHIAFLDSDDWWHCRKLELQLQQMDAAGALVSYASYQRMAEDGRALSIVRPPAVVGYAEMLQGNHIGNLTGIYDRRMGDGSFRKIGHEDYVFWLERVRRAGRAIRVEHDEPLAYYLVREGSVSANKLRAAAWQWRIYRDVESLGLLHASWCFMHYARNALSKRR